MAKLKSVRVTFGVGMGLLLVGLGFAVGWFMFDPGRQISKYPLLDPSVINPGMQQQQINFDPLRQQVKSYLKSLNTSYGLYFEYLPNGSNIRVDDDSATVAASLMKTPVVMDLYKLAEAGKINLDDTVTIEQSDISNDQEYGDTAGLTAGQTISLRNAARLALNNSDNTAVSIIKRVISPLVTDDTDSIQSLDIAYTFGTDGSGNPTPEKVLKINARSYGSILKCLYYACFVNADDSQEILGNLVGSSGIDRLTAGVPSSVKVAHKVGSAVKAQSDCGIIYQPGKPYLICLMFWDYSNSSGKETSVYFKTVSKMINDYITKTTP
jgi:beta-lactamase class A